MSAKSERAMYEPVRRELTEKFSVSGKVHLEISADGKISETVKEKLDDVCLHIINFEKLKPDIIGFLRTETRTGRSAGRYQDDMIIAEVKNEQVGIMDLVQTKAYAEVFGAAHAFLVSSEPIPEEIKRFVKMKPVLLLYQGGYGEVKLVQFDAAAETFVEKSWYRESPFEESVEELESEGADRKVESVAKSWEAMLQWADPSVRVLVKALNNRLELELPNIRHAPLARWYAYHIDSEDIKTKRFLVLIARKKGLRCRIRVDPNKFEDKEHRTNDLRGWFYARLSGVEKGFTIAAQNDIDKVLPLIRQSYDFVRAESVK